MPVRSWVLAAALCWSASAGAVTCYVVIDRNDNVLYRSSMPPVDMSDNGVPARERMRQRGESLMFGDFDSCPGITFLTGAGGTSMLRLDEVVGGMPATGLGGTRTDAAVPPPSATTRRR
jgi:hypothetical protein